MLPVLAALASCAPDFAYTRVLGEHRFDLSCPRGFPECAAMASQLCTTGYNVETTKSGMQSSGVIVRCNPPAPPRVVRSECAPAREKAAQAPPKPQCAADYQCTATGARCVNGVCAVAPVIAAADETDRCMVTNTTPEPVPMFPTEGALAEYISTKAESRAADFMNVTRLQGVWVDVGVRCKTLGAFAGGRNVQLISGTLAGREGWLRTDATPTTAPAAVR